jgi:putative transposase
MIVHPGDLVRWNDEDLQVVAVRATYTTLRNAEMGEDLEVLNADLAERGEPATVRSTDRRVGLGCP